jgi:hypothetical protein
MDVCGFVWICSEKREKKKRKEYKEEIEHGFLGICIKKRREKKKKGKKKKKKNGGCIYKCVHIQIYILAIRRMTRWWKCTIAGKEGN